ncbi:MAG: beta-lactamase family protein [Spirochaetaceae bacterium]
MLKRFYIAIILSLFIPVYISSSISDVDLVLFESDLKASAKELMIPGFAFTLIEDGKTIHDIKYGYSDLESATKVTDKTVFRIASSSKLYVFMAVLKLIEENKMNPEAYVSDYITNPKLKKILKELQVKHILTHSEGFSSRDLNSLSITDISESIKDLMIKELKSPIMTPGNAITYGGFGTVVAALIIEEVTKMSYSDYIEQVIFIPMNMDHSTFNQNVPKNLKQSLATTYFIEDGEYINRPFLYLTTPPSGGASMTSQDFSSSIKMLTNSGYYDGKQILSESSLSYMLDTQLTSNSGIGGSTFGFLEYYYNGKKILERIGSGVGIFSKMLIIPEDNIGFTYIQNIRDEGEVEMHDIFTRQLLNILYGEDQAETEVYIPSELKKYKGHYRIIQYHRNVMKLALLVAGEYSQVSMNNNNKLILTTKAPGDVYGWGGMPDYAELIPVSKNLFRRSDNNHYIYFEEDNNGKIVNMFSDAGYHSTYEKVTFIENPDFLIISTLIVFLLSFVSIILIIVTIIKNRKSRGVFSMLLITISSLLLYTPLTLAILMNKKEGFPAIAFGIPPLARVTLMLPYILVALDLFIVYRFSKSAKSLTKRSKLLFTSSQVLIISLMGIIIFWRLISGLHI